MAKAIIERIAAEHAKTIDQNPIQVYVDELADSCIYIGMRVWCRRMIIIRFAGIFWNG